METDPLAGVSLTDGLNDEAMADTMDDLFGEHTNGLNLGDVDVVMPATGPPPSAALLGRISEMQTSNCCTKLAWSNTGSVARISPDGSKLDIRILSKDLHTNNWSLGQPSKHHITAPLDCHFVHLQYNHVGQDVAVVDNKGRVHQYSISGGNGKLQLATINSPNQDRYTELDAVIGMHWLPIYPLDCRAMYLGPANRSINGWTSKYHAREPATVKVHHPVDNLRAMLFISRNGILTLRFQQDGWQSITTTLDTFTLPETLLTHADMCEHNGGLLLVTFDMKKTLKLFSVVLDWHIAYSRHPSNPAVTTHHITSVHPELHTTELLGIPDPTPHHISNARLSSLSLIPAIPEMVDQSSSTNTTVLATYVRASVTDPVSQYQEASTAIVRWQVDSETTTLHKAFRDLKPNTQISSDLGSRTVLRRQADILTPKIILSTHSQCFDSILACVASDGTIDFRDRSSFDLLESYMDVDHVNSLPQSGFTYQSGEHNVHAAISYDGAAMAVIRSSGKLESLHMQFQYGWQRVDDSSESNALAEAAIVCIARQYMSMTCGNVSPDDVLALLPPSLPEDLRLLFNKEVFRLVRHNPDVQALEEKVRQNIVLRELLIPRAFSLQLCLGQTSTGRSLTSQYAWALLNLRHVCVSISQVIMRIDSSQSFSSDLILSLRGLAKWGVDLLIYITNALFSVRTMAIADMFKPARAVFQQYMQDTNNPAFLLVLCSYPRTLLKILVNVLPKLIKLAQVSAPRAISIVDKQQLIEVGSLMHFMPSTFDAFKNFLDQTDIAMDTHVLNIHGNPANPPVSPDAVMMTTGTFPEQTEQSLQALIFTMIPALLENADLAKVCFADVSWLGLNGQKSIELAKTFDVLKKTPLPAGAKLRQCRRCDSVMEDISTDKPRDLASWLVSAQRYCLCMCTWFVP